MIIQNAISFHFAAYLSFLIVYFPRTDRRIFFHRKRGSRLSWKLWESFINFIRHRLPRESAQRSNLRKMQIGGSPNFPRLDKLTGCQPYPPSRPDPRRTGKGGPVVDEVCETGWTEIERITAERENRGNCIIYHLGLQTSFITVR